MSWLNNSISTIRGQLSTLAQEVLAETAGPGDDEYVAGPLEAETALEVLADAQKECEKLTKMCIDKDAEIVVLRKQITELQNIVSDTGGGNGAGAATKATTTGRTSKSPTDHGATLEDSWCWEPDNIKSDNDHCSESSSGHSGEMVNITLEEVAMGRSAAKKAKRLSRQSTAQSAELQNRVKQLEEDNKKLNAALEELDTQHNQAMENVLHVKTDLQSKLTEANKNYAALKKEKDEKFISTELDLARLKKQYEDVQTELHISHLQRAEALQKNDDHVAELRSTMMELADLHELLEKKAQDNLELLDRIREANRANEEASEVKSELQEKLEMVCKELEELKLAKEKRNEGEESSATGSTGKQSDDEFIVVGEGDTTSSGPTTPPSKEQMKDKIVQLENKLSELTLENGSLSLKLQDSQMEKELSSNVLENNFQDLEKKLEEEQYILIAMQEELAEERERNVELKEKAADAILVKEKMKILCEEKEKMEYEIKNLKEVLQRIEELEKRLKLSEQEKESLQLELQSMRLHKEQVQELEQKIQTLTYENQQRSLDTEAETEVRNKNVEWEEKLKALTEENETLRAELEHAKFAQAIVDEKRVTDLDADEELEEPFNYRKLKEQLEVFYKRELSEIKEEFGSDGDSPERTYKALYERLMLVDSLQKTVATTSENLIDLQACKLAWEHEKKTLEADISQYILQCDELMKSNEILLNELDNYKRNKLETISENNEENMLQLETALDECTKLNRTLEEEYAEMTDKIVELEREQQVLSEKLTESQALNERWKTKEKDFELQVETLELEKCNLQFELDEWKAKEGEEKSDKATEALREAEAKCISLTQQLERLSRDHADLVGGMQAQKAALGEALKKREELEKVIEEQEWLIEKSGHEIAELTFAKVRSEECRNELQNQLADRDAECLEQSEMLEQGKAQIFQNLQELTAKDGTIEILQSQLNFVSETEEMEALKVEHQELLNKYSVLRNDFNDLQSTFETQKENQRLLQEQYEALQTQSAVNLLEWELLKAGERKSDQDYEELQQKFEAQSLELKELQEKANSGHDESVGRIAKLEAELLATADLQKAVDSLNFEKQEMIKALQQKHSENMYYYMEIQRLQPIMQNLQQEVSDAKQKQCSKCSELEAKLKEQSQELEKQQDQINFLKEKSNILTTNLLTEQTNQKLVQQEMVDVLQQNASLLKDIERLREHLLEIEEQHTQEALEMQRELEDTKAKMASVQEEVAKSSNAYTSASIRANQHAETLQAQYALVVQQRDDLVNKLSSAEDRESKNQAALCNLQCALEQFQNDKENDIKSATQRIRKELQLHQLNEKQLQGEINALNQRLDDANQGLCAASRLSDQLEACQSTIASLREEVEAHKAQRQNVEHQLLLNESSQSDKIDKSLIKSLLIGYVVSGNPNDKAQVLRMISSVLEFTTSEADKVGLNKQQTTWFGSILGGRSESIMRPNQNLVQAFVQFLEQESQPKVNQDNMPNLLNMTQAAAMGDNISPSTRRSSVSSNNGNPTSHPILLNANVIDEFAPSRNSTSILKDILSDT